jgi:hypothetical protein
VTDFREEREAGGARTTRGTRVTPEDTTSATWRAETTHHREAMQHELMQLGLWLTEHPEAARKNLKPIRSAKVLEPGVYYNMGTGMVDRIYSPQHVPLGHRLFRVSTDPAAPVAEIRRRVVEGK